MRPEILTLDPAKVDQFVAAEPKLKDYKQYLDNILRMKAHTLNPAGEKLVAQANGQMAGSRRVHLFHLHQRRPALPART